MPISKYLALTIGSKKVQISNPEDLPISIDYALEDVDNFQNKKSAEALSVEVPATLMNDIAGNTFRNADYIDLTDGKVFRSNQPFILDENGYEIMNGKAFLESASHTTKPTQYVFNLFGDNADWKVDLEESTLFDFLKSILFMFETDKIIASWSFDGTDPELPYVFAPVRYRAPIGGTSLDADGKILTVDNNMAPIYMRPSLSKYWLIFNAFKSVGYRIKSDFMDSEYFRRQVMPWTWGNFLDSDGTRLETHKFLAKSVGIVWQKFKNGRTNFFWNLNVSNNSKDGAFDNNHDYTWDSNASEMKWTYNPPDFGELEATFSMQVAYDAHLNGSTSEIELYAYWYKTTPGNAPQQIGVSEILKVSGDFVFTPGEVGIKTIYFKVPGTVESGDIISVKLWLTVYKAAWGHANISASVREFKLEFFRIPLGGTIDFNNYTGLKKYKFLDYFRGVIDEFDLSFNTDPINKVVVIEPTHSYSVTNDHTDTNPGYFVDDFIDWNKKEDLSKEWKMDNYSDYDRELTFKYKSDNNDGLQKKIQDRNINTLAAGKYVFPGRFKAGKKDIENRFFSATMHYEVDQWKELGTGNNQGISPQMVCIIPENISNTSNTESENTFLPKSCYYKGLITGAGAWVFNRQDSLGESGIRQQYPFLFAVNYKPGGENDPILSYSDEKISDGAGGFVIGKGLLKRFFWQRLAIMRNGQWYNCWFRLKNVDVAGKLHREFKSYRGQRWELINITGYRPLLDASTAVLLRRWAPVSLEDFNATYPSEANVLAGTSVDPLDIKYATLKVLSSDIPA